MCRELQQLHPEASGIDIARKIVSLVLSRMDTADASPMYCAAAGVLDWLEFAGVDLDG
jgi:hypothetical protein